jgi:outer membrane protein
MDRVSLIFWMEGSKNKMRALFLFLILGVLRFPLAAQDTVVLSLKQCIDLALKNNMDLLRSTSIADISGQRLWQSRAAFLPSLNGYISQGQNAGKSINPYTNTYVNQKIITGQYGISSSTTLWSGFYNINNMRYNAFNNRANEMDLEQARLDLILSVMSAYLAALSNEEQLNLTALQVDLSQRQVNRLIVLEKNQSVSPNIIFDAKGQLATDQLSLTDARNAVENSKLALLQIINLGEMKPVKLVKIDSELKQWNEQPDATLQSALHNLPLAKASGLRVQAAKKAWHASQGLVFPTLSLYASLGSNYSDAASIQHYVYAADASTDNYVVINNVKTPVIVPQYSVTQEKIDLQKQIKNNLSSYVGLNLQVPIFNSFRTKTQVGISKINYHLASDQNKYNINKLGIDIRRAYANMAAAKERYEIIRQQSEFYAESLKIAISKFEKGMITTVDYTFAKNNSNRANLNHVVLKYDYYLKLKTLEYFGGQMKVE